MKARQVTSTGGANPQLRENSHEAVRTDESLAEIADVSSNTIRKIENIEARASRQPTHAPQSRFKRHSSGFVCFVGGRLTVTRRAVLCASKLTRRAGLAGGVGTAVSVELARG